MRTNIYYLFLVLMALLLMSCDSRNITRKEINSTIEYDVIEIDSCEYIMVQSRTYYGCIVNSIGNKGNCKYCKERNNTTNISNLVDLSNTTVNEEKLRENHKTE